MMNCSGDVGETITFVEDVTTTGGSVVRAITKLNEMHVRTDRYFSPALTGVR